MKLEIVTSPIGAELTSIKYNSEERLHQGESVLDKEGKVFWKRHAPVLFPIVGSLKNNTTYIDGKNMKCHNMDCARYGV